MKAAAARRSPRQRRLPVLSAPPTSGPGAARNRRAIWSGPPEGPCGGAIPGGGRGARGLTSASPPALRVPRSHGERRAAVAGPVHPPGHQLCRHRRPVLRVPAEGPGRPRAQGQCWSQPGLSRLTPAPGNGEPAVRLGPLQRPKLPQRGNRP